MRRRYESENLLEDLTEETIEDYLTARSSHFIYSMISNDWFGVSAYLRQNEDDLVNWLNIWNDYEED
jgi:hypothetical protein